MPMTRRNLFRTLLGAMVGLLAPWSKAFAPKPKVMKVTSIAPDAESSPRAEPTCVKVAWELVGGTYWLVTFVFSDGSEHPIPTLKLPPEPGSVLRQTKRRVNEKWNEWFNAAILECRKDRT